MDGVTKIVTPYAGCNAIKIFNSRMGWRSAADRWQ